MKHFLFFYVTISMKRIIGIIGLVLSIICLYQIFTNYKGFQDWIELTFGDGFISIVVGLFAASSIFSWLGFLLMIFGRPFSYVFLSGNRGEVNRHQNIRDFMKYRNGLMGGMSPENSAQLYNETAIVDQLMASGQGQNTQDTINYINGRLGGLSPDNQIKFLRGEKNN